MIIKVLTLINKLQHTHSVVHCSRAVARITCGIGLMKYLVAKREMNCLFLYTTSFVDLHVYLMLVVQCRQAVYRHSAMCGRYSRK